MLSWKFNFREQLQAAGCRQYSRCNKAPHKEKSVRFMHRKFDPDNRSVCVRLMKKEEMYEETIDVTWYNNSFIFSLQCQLERPCNTGAGKS
jgi:hypothetical protein